MAGVDGYVRGREPERHPAFEEFFVFALATVESNPRSGFNGASREGEKC